MQFCTHLLVASFRLSLALREDASFFFFLLLSTLRCEWPATLPPLEFHGFFATSTDGVAIYLSLKKEEEKEKEERAITCP